MPLRIEDETYYGYRAGALGEHLVDEATCADLDLGEVFEAVDRCSSSPGRSTLYAWMRSQATSPGRLEARLGPARWFETRPREAEAARKALARLGLQSRGNIAQELWGSPGSDYLRFKRYFHLWEAASLALVLGAIALGFYPVIVTLAVVLVNLAVFAKTNPLIGAHADDIRYLGRMIDALRRLSALLPSGTGVSRLDELPRLREASRRIPTGGALFGTPGAGLSVAAAGGDLASMLIDYYRIFCLGELRAYFRFYAAFERYREEISAIYETIGALDAGLSLVRLLSEGKARRSELSEGRPGLAVEGMAHPLVEACVPVSFQAGRGLVITGTNMSGKSTFLRSLGINAILATTLGLAFAESFRTYPYRVIGAIGLDDDLLAGKSRYLAEAERLLHTIRACEAGPTLALVDEILSGTNGADRIAASIGILKGLAGSGSLVVAATHDLEIAHATAGLYDAYHFSERVDSGDFSFDYALKPGIVDRRNALAILERLGFGAYVPSVDAPGAG